MSYKLSIEKIIEGGYEVSHPPTGVTLYGFPAVISHIIELQEQFMYTFFETSPLLLDLPESEAEAVNDLMMYIAYSQRRGKRPAYFRFYRIRL